MLAPGAPGEARHDLDSQAPREQHNTSWSPKIPRADAQTLNEGGYPLGDVADTFTCQTQQD